MYSECNKVSHTGQKPVSSEVLQHQRWKKGHPHFFLWPRFSTDQAEEPGNTMWAGALPQECLSSFPQLTSEAFSDSIMNHCPASLLENMKLHLSMFTI